MVLSEAGGRRSLRPTCEPPSALGARFQRTPLCAYFMYILLQNLLNIGGQAKIRTHCVRLSEAFF